MNNWGLPVELLQVVICLLLLVVAYFLRGVLREIKEIKESQRLCQLSLAKEYRLKRDAEDDSRRQWEELDELGNRMTRVETILAGDGK